MATDTSRFKAGQRGAKINRAIDGNIVGRSGPHQNARVIGDGHPFPSEADGSDHTLDSDD